ncbi:MAG TPA: ABC transporter permease [Mycobacteriales bacterium]|nr:ABC transporter permease [Mycobacteriales bacterium]
MAQFLVRRLLYMIVTLFLVSIVSFLIIQLPPGDFLSTVITKLQQQGQTADPAYLASLRARYALDQPVYQQYWTWITNILLHGDFGQSFQHGQPVSTLLKQRLPLTLTLGISTLLFSWIIALPAGVYSAVRKYSIGDYAMTVFAFLGIAIPGFLIALLVAYLEFRYFNNSIGGLFSARYVDAAWNLGKVIDLFSHLWLPVVVLSIGGIGGTVRIFRANLLDELHKPYVITARAKGLSERRLLTTYPVRVALNPFVSTIGWVLPGLIGGEVIVAKVLSLQTTGPLLLEALQAQDMYLAGSIILILSALTVVGTLLSDILLGIVDPRIRQAALKKA